MTAALDYWLSAIEAHAICAGHAPDVAAALARRVVSGIELSPEGDPEASGAGIPPSLSAPAEAGCNRREQPVGASFCGEDG